MQGNPAVIDAFNAVYRECLATEQQAHLIEHLLEAEGWKKLSDIFDDIEDHIHTKIIHKLIKRVNKLRARVTPKYAFEPQCWGHREIEQALKSTLGHLVDIRGKAGEGDSSATGLLAVCYACEMADDYKSQDLAHKFIDWVECKITEFENHLDHIQTIGLEEFLSEMMD